MIPKKSSRILLSVIALAILALTGCNDFFGGNLGFEKETLRGALDQECREDVNDRCNSGLKCNEQNKCVPEADDRGTLGKQCLDTDPKCVTEDLVCNTAGTCEKKKGIEGNPCREDVNDKCDKYLTCDTQKNTCVAIEDGDQGGRCKTSDPMCNGTLVCDSTSESCEPPNAGTLNGVCRTSGEQCNKHLACDNAQNVCKQIDPGKLGGACKGTDPKCDEGQGLICDTDTCVTCADKHKLVHPITKECVDVQCDPQASPAIACSNDEFCLDQFCIKNADRCKLTTCDAGYKCDDNNGQCVPDCTVAEQCNGVCCTSDEVCFKGKAGDTCVAKPADNKDVCYLDKSGAPQVCDTDESCIEESCISNAGIGDECDLDTAKYCLGKAFCDTKPANCVDYDAVKPALCLAPVNYDFEMVEVLTWQGSKKTAVENYNQVMTTPLAFDGKLIFAAFNRATGDRKTVLFVIDGVADPNDPTLVTEYWNSQDDDLPGGKFFVDGGTTMALGDIDPSNGDGPEIIVPTYPGPLPEQRWGLLAINLESKVVKWRINDLGYQDGRGTGVDWALSIADVDADGTPEIITPFGVRSGANGNLICKYANYTNVANTKDHEISRAPIAVDLNGDGELEIVGGGHVRKVSTATGGICGTYGTDYNFGETGHRLVAVADVTNDGINPEIIVSNRCTLYLFNHLNDNLISKIDFPEKASCGTWYGGAPTVADFDNDGKLEIGVAGLENYTVYKYDDSTSPPKLTVAWQYSTMYDPSGKTGSTAFDFNSDGISEIIYNDNKRLRVFHGDDQNDPIKQVVEGGQITNYTNTLLENPIVVDLNNDGSAEIVVASNTQPTSSVHPDYDPRAPYGIRVFKEKHNRWSGTRQVWNQHAYNPTFIDDNGKIPTTPPLFWKNKWSNNFRTNPITTNVRLTAELRPDFVSLFEANTCNAENERKITYRIYNDGEKGVAKDRSVTKILIRESGTPTWTEIYSELNDTEIPAHGSIDKEVTLDFSQPALSTFKGKTLDFRIDTDADKQVVECSDKNNDAEVHNVPVIGRDLKIEIVSVEDSQCAKTTPDPAIKVKVKITNDGSEAITSDKNLDFNIIIGSGRNTKKQTFTVGADIEASNFHEEVVDVLIDAAYINKPLQVAATVNETGAVKECVHPGGFTQYTAAPVACYKLD